MDPHVESILSWLNQLPAGESDNSNTLTAPMDAFYQNIVQRFGYSTALQLQLHSLLHYAELSQITSDQLTPLLPKQESGKPAQKKLEGKRFLHELEQRIIP